MIFDNEDYSYLEWDVNYTRNLELFSVVDESSGDGGGAGDSCEIGYGEEYGDDEGDGTGNGFEEFLIESYNIDYYCNGTGNGYINNVYKYDGNGVGAGLSRETVRNNLLELAQELY